VHFVQLGAEQTPFQIGANCLGKRMPRAATFYYIQVLSQLDRAIAKKNLKNLLTKQLCRLTAVMEIGVKCD
jgi:hypothetical protein